MTSFYTSRRVAELTSIIGNARIGPYLAMAGGDHRRALDLYVWNLSLGAAFYGPLGILEVTIRNALHGQLSALFGPSWPTDTRFITVATKIRDSIYPVNANTYRRTINTDLLADIEKAKRKVAAELLKKAGMTGDPAARLAPTADDIVAALEFGYWTALMNRDVEPVLYAAGLYRAFPCAPRARGKEPARGTIAWKINKIRRFRNRVMHHEPLFNRINLHQDFRNIVQMCRWTGISTGDWIDHHSRFEEVLRNRAGPVYVF
jgi:hypothetical protein